MGGLSGNAFRQGWEWVVEGASKYHPGVVYLRRSQPLQRYFHPSSSSSPSFDEGDETFLTFEEDDDAALPVQSTLKDKEDARQACRVEVSVCWSPSFGVPVLWFEAVKSSGAPLTLSDLSTCTFFHSSSRPSLFSPSSSASPCTSSDSPRLPFLSQADHPATGRPSWFIHPCETETMVEEVLSSTDEGQEKWETRWMRTWMMVISSVVDLRA